MLPPGGPECPGSGGRARSPVFIGDGVDLFAHDEVAGSMACCVYATPDGRRDVPELRIVASHGRSEPPLRESLTMDTPTVTAQGHPGPPPGQCWCCGSIDDPERMVHL